MWVQKCRRMQDLDLDFITFPTKGHEHFCWRIEDKMCKEFSWGSIVWQSTCFRRSLCGCPLGDCLPFLQVLWYPFSVKVLSRSWRHPITEQLSALLSSSLGAFGFCDISFSANGHWGASLHHSWKTVLSTLCDFHSILRYIMGQHWNWAIAHHLLVSQWVNNSLDNAFTH